MMYQGHLVNFSQPTDAQFNALITEVGRTNQQVRTNSVNLVNMGKDMTTIGVNMTKIGQDNTYFGKAITNLDTAVRQLISTGTGQGMTQQQVEQIVENYHGDDIALLYSNHEDQEQRLTDAFNDRRIIDAKANATQAEHGKFNDTLSKIGMDMTDLGKSLSGKAGINHTHNGGDPEDCGWFGEKCWFKNLLPNLSSTAIVAVGGIAAYFLLKGKLKI
jgi:hypothetical protein